MSGDLKGNGWLFFSLLPIFWLESLLEELLDRELLMNWPATAISAPRSPSQCLGWSNAGASVFAGRTLLRVIFCEDLHHLVIRLPDEGVKRRIEIGQGQSHVFFKRRCFTDSRDIKIPVLEDGNFSDALDVDEPGGGPGSQHVVDLCRAPLLPIGFVV